MTVDTDQQFFLLRVFWKEMFIILIGSMIFFNGLFNIINKLSTLSIIWLTMGLIITLYGLFSMNKHFKKIRK